MAVNRPEYAPRAALGDASIPAMVRRLSRAHPWRVILRHKEGAAWKPLTWADLAARMEEAALAARACGIWAGQVGCILSETRPEWVYAELGLLSLGAISAGIHPADNASRIREILRETAARIVFVENEEQLRKVLAVREDCPALRRIVIFDTKGLGDLADPMCESFAAFMKTGARTARATPGLWAAAIAARGPEETALLIYTAGTTDAPRAAMLSHRAVLYQAAHTAALLGQRAGDRRLAFLPMCHPVERIQGLYQALVSETESHYVECPEAVAEDLQACQPTFMAAASRTWEKLHARAMLAMADATCLQRFAYRAALGAGQRVADAHLAGRPAPLLARLSAFVLRKLVLSPVRRDLGLNRLRIGLVGAMPVAPTLIRWFAALGVPLTEFYGTAECAGLAAHATPGMGRAALIPARHGEIRLSARSEVLVRGECLFDGYWRNPALTALTMEDGWFRTGDLARLENGVLHITGRRNAVATVTRGHAMAPAELENALKLSPYIADALVLGNGRTFLACLILIDAERVATWARDNNVRFIDFTTLARAGPVRRLIARDVARVNAASGDAIREFRLVDRKLEPDAPEFAPVATLHRGPVANRYRALIEAMYP